MVIGIPLEKSPKENRISAIPSTVKEFIKSGYFDSRYKDLFTYYDGMCPIAEKVQSQMMSFKTNYRDIEEAKLQASILKNVIHSIT